MTANVIVTVEREFDNPRSQVFRAWTEPASWRSGAARPGWHVELETLAG